jgi:hypothetical protein
MTTGINASTTDFLRNNIGKLLFLFGIFLSSIAIILLRHDWGAFLIALPFFSCFSALVHDYFAFRRPSAQSMHRSINHQGHKALNRALLLPYERLLWPCIILGGMLKLFR